MPTILSAVTLTAVFGHSENSKFGITDTGNFDRLKVTDYPILSDLYALIEEEYKAYDESHRQLYTVELLQNILLGLHSICKGAESKFFDGTFGNNKKNSVLEQFCIQKFIDRKENKICPTKDFENGIKEMYPIKQKKPLCGICAAYRRL